MPTEPVVVQIDAPLEAAGSSLCSVTVTVTNSGNDELENVEVAPQQAPGKLKSRQAGLDRADTRTTDMQRRVLIGEIETFVQAAYEAMRRSKMNLWDRFVAWWIIMPELAVPEESLRINDWADVEALEASVINAASTADVIKTGFTLAKEKLRRHLGSDLTAPLRQPLSLSPGSSAAFPFTVRVFKQWRPSAQQITFTVTYRETATRRTAARPIAQQLRLLPSPWVIPVGGLAGGLIGQLIHLAIAGADISTNLMAAGGYAFLGGALALLAARRPDTVRAVSVEDFWGGVVVGVLAGLFGNEILARLASLVAAKT